MFSFNKKKLIDFEPRFNGWGMASMSYTPWECDLKNPINRKFSQINKKILNDLEKKKIRSFHFEKNNRNKNFLEGLAWRFYIIFLSSYHCSKRNTNMIECGTADGISAMYALEATKINKKIKNFYIYDSFTKMNYKILKRSEKSKSSNYSYLDYQNTKKNLSKYSSFIKLNFNIGLIPEVFKIYKKPKSISWLHIDLNSSIATKNCLDYFFNNMVKNGIILFDDYARPGYEQTRYVVNKFFKDKNKSNNLYVLPTGQALFLNN